MTDFDQFERRLAAALRSDADQSVDSFEAGSIARAAIADTRRHGKRLPWASSRRARRFGLGRGMTLLAAAALLLGSGALAAGSGILRLPSVVPPVPAPSVVAVATASPDATSPSPSGSAAPSASPSPCPRFLPSTTPDQTPQSLSWTEPRPGIRLDLPAGWQPTTAECPGPLVLSLIYGTDPHLGGLTIRANPVLGSNDEPCPGRPAKGVGSSATEMVAALLVDPRLAVVAGPAITIDGRPTHVLDIQLAPGFTGSCQPGDGQPHALLFIEPGSLIGLTGNDRVRVILLDVGDVPVLIFVGPMENAFDDFVARTMALIDGLTFVP